jgi:alpha-glucosidase
MNQMLLVATVLSALALPGCGAAPVVHQTQSPDGRTVLAFALINGSPTYSVTRDGKPVILSSRLGFEFQSQPPLAGGLVVAGTDRSQRDETWEQPWGETRLVRDHHNELVVTLEEAKAPGRRFQVVFRAFDDGVALRYRIPRQEGLESLLITDELTEFVLTGDHTAWWIPAYQDNRYEYLYETTKVSGMDKVHTPLTMRTADGLHLAIHEAALVDYASMTLARVAANTLVADLVPWSDGIRVRAEAPLETPWRTIQIAESAGDLITSYMILNLNEPSVVKDTSWIQPSKYMGIWWGMHIGKYTFWEGEQHGATTENAKMYIDFASEHGIPLLLVEGWNPGWTEEWYLDRMHEFSFTRSTPDFDLEDVVAYGRSKGVELIGYHETGSNLVNYLAQIDEAMALYERLGIHNIKIGQVGTRLNMEEWHHGQFGVRYYREVLEKAAEHKLAVNFHEPIKDTGERRTYPHMMTREGARGQEYDAWSEGNPPSHHVILPFTRMLASPMDFTPGVLDVMIKEREGRRVHTTVAKQLAFYVTYFSPMQMLADLPENYDGHPALRFLLDVPVDWDETLVLNGEIGEFLTVVRKDRHGPDWYLGSITNESQREFEIGCDFLAEGRRYVAEIYSDGPDADWEGDPISTQITRREMTRGSRLPIRLATGGGQAIRFRAVPSPRDTGAQVAVVN